MGLTADAQAYRKQSLGDSLLGRGGRDDRYGLRGNRGVTTSSIGDKEGGNQHTDAAKHQPFLILHLRSANASRFSRDQRISVSC